MKKILLSVSILTLLAGCGNNTQATSPTPPASTATPVATTTDAPATTAPISTTPMSSAHSDIQMALQDNLAKSGIDVAVTDISPSGMPDIYMISLANMPPVFTDKTGTYIIQGDIIELGAPTPVNISAKAHSVVNKQILLDVPTSEMIVFPAKGETKAAIYVFSDPTCHYCQMLHKDMSKLNSKGIEVRYLAWPRSERSVPIAEAVWCNADPHQAMTDAKSGTMPNSPSCDNPVRRHMQIGLNLGVSGTPAVFTESGEQIGGYLPADDMAAAAIAGK